METRFSWGYRVGLPFLYPWPFFRINLFLKDKFPGDDDVR